MSNPFDAKKAAAPAATSVEAVVETPAVAAPKTTKKGADRKPSAQQLSAADRKFIINSWSSKGTKQIADELTATNGREVTKQQVYRTGFDFRKGLGKELEAAQAAGDAAKVAKIESLLALVPAMEAFGGGGTGKKGSAIDDLINEFMG